MVPVRCVVAILQGDLVLSNSKPTEASIQNALFFHLRDKGHSHIAPNCCALGWEADLVSITGAGYACEYEVKISRSDFFADTNKKEKHTFYKGSERKRQRTQAERIPCRFFYVAPAGLVSIQDIPIHAGLIEVQGQNISVTKDAPRLHREKASDVLKERITNSLMWKVFTGKTREAVKQPTRTRWPA